MTPLVAVVVGAAAGVVLAAAVAYTVLTLVDDIDSLVSF